MSLRCFVCDRGPQQGVSIYRINAKGQPGMWACEQHMAHTDAKPDPQLKEVVKALERKADQQTAVQSDSGTAAQGEE